MEKGGGGEGDERKGIKRRQYCQCQIFDLASLRTGTSSDRRTCRLVRRAVQQETTYRNNMKKV